MNYNTSQLQIEQSGLMRYNFEFITTTEIDSVDINLLEIFNSYSINLNFFYKELSSNNFEIFVKLTLNEEKKFGYYIFIEIGSIFKFIEDVKEPDRTYLTQSALGIVINKIREKIIMFTSDSPMGSYRLPIVDLNNLINEKNKESEKKKETEQSS